MKYILAGLATAVIFSGIFVAGFLNGQHIVKTPSQTFAGFTPVQGSTYYLAGAGINNSQTTIQLSSFDLPDPNKTPINNSMFSGTQYGVLEAQTSKIENISYTAVTQNGNGTATLTGVTRGISFYSPFVSSTTLALSHAGGATFILSNPAVFYSNFASPNNTNYWLATQTFGSTTPPVYDADPIWANFSTQVFADVSYVNSVVAAGAANASETVKGIVQLATNVQLAAGTSLGSTGARLGIPNSLATSTPTVSCTSGCVPVAVNGFISQLFLNLTASWSFTGAFSLAASTGNKLTLDGLAYVWPASRAASSTVLSEDGNGNLTFEPLQFSIPFTNGNGSPNLSTAAGATSTLLTVTIPGNTLSTTKGINISATFGNSGLLEGGSNRCSFEVDIGTGLATTSMGNIVTTVSGSTVQLGTFSGTLYATSTAQELGHFVSSAGSAGNNTPYSPSFVATDIYTVYSNTANLYIGFAANAVGAGGQICNLFGNSVQLISK